MIRVRHVGVTDEAVDGENELQRDGDSAFEQRGARLSGILAFLIGVVVQISIPLTNLYDIPNVRAVFFVFVLGVFALRFLSGEPIRAGSFLLMSYLGLSMILAVGILYSRAPVYGTGKVILVFAYFWLVGGVFYNLFEDLWIGRAFLSGLVVGGLLLVGITAAEFGNPIEMFQRANRFFRLRFGDEGNPILLARHLALAVTAIITYVVIRRKWIDAVWSIPLVLLALAYLIGTGSKGPLLALVLSGILTVMLFIKGTVARLGFTVFLVGGIVFAAIEILESLPKGFVEERFTEKVQNLSLRLPAYRDIVQELLKSDAMALLVGHGTGDYGYFALGHDERSYPHNIVLEVIYENGLLGLCLLTVALCYPIGAFLRASVQQLETTHRVLLAGFSACYLATLINAQTSGDLGSNLLIGMFGAATVRVSHMGSDTFSND